MHRRRVLAPTIGVAVALIALAACGAPAAVRTLHGEPDLVRIDGKTIPHGFTASVSEELERLRAACVAIDANVGAELPDLAKIGGASHLRLIDGQCEWLPVPAIPSSYPPELIVGILANPSGGSTLDQTTAVLTDERAIAGVGERAAFDPQTRTLYALQHGRLWYLQLIGSSAPAIAAPRILTSIGRALMQTPSAR